MHFDLADLRLFIHIAESPSLTQGARRHSRTMKLATIELDEPWAIRERSLLVRDLEALPSCLRALIEELQRVGDSL